MTVAKPIIFFSHASADAPVLLRLKAKLETKIAQAVAVFLDCDCQCIRYGENWNAAIAANLDAAKLVFVFLSPEALQSHWVAYEAGYISALKKPVIPVGIRGVDTRKLRNSPFPSLQGFSISGKDGLNNLIQTINAQFAEWEQYRHLAFELSFSDRDYEELFGENAKSVIFGEYERYVSCVERCITAGPRASVDTVVKILGRHNLPNFVVPYSANEVRINTSGAVISAYEDSASKEIRFSIDPVICHLVSVVVEDLIAHEGWSSQSGWQVVLSRRVEVEEAVRRSALCHGTDIGIIEWTDESQLFHVKSSGVRFSFTWDTAKTQWAISLKPKGGGLETYSLRSLWKVLIETGLIKYH